MSRIVLSASLLLPALLATVVMWPALDAWFMSDDLYLAWFVDPAGSGVEVAWDRIRVGGGRHLENEGAVTQGVDLHGSGHYHPVGEDTMRTTLASTILASLAMLTLAGCQQTGGGRTPSGGGGGLPVASQAV